MAGEQAVTAAAPVAVSSPLSSPPASPAASDPPAIPAVAGSDPKPASPDTTGKTAPDPAVTRPEGLPDSYWDSQKNTLKVDAVALVKDLKERDELKTFKAAEDVKALSRPQTAEAYKIELPADFKAPAGIEFKFDDKDPILTKAREWAHGAGLTQEQFQQSLGLYAAAKVGEQTQIKAARDAEIGKLGSTAGTRVDAVIQWMTGMDASTDKGDAKALAGMLVTARHVEAFERIITRLTTQGSAAFSQQHRVAQDDKEIPGFATMSFEQKRQAQDQRRAQRAG